MKTIMAKKFLSLLRPCAVFCISVFLLLTGMMAGCFNFPDGMLLAYAGVQLPDGAVAGLPEKLTVLDSDGSSVSDSGEYFFRVENMQPYVPYTKDIQIMNLREDYAYHIYFYAEPISASGEIDLENDCTVVFTLNGEQVFEGKVTGESADGSTNLADEPIDLGSYAPGETGKLTCTVTWSGESADIQVDYGEKLVTSDGISIIREGSGDAYIEGEVTFRWIFYAAVDESYTPPKTGLNAPDSWVYICILTIFLLLILAMTAAVVMKNRKRKAVHDESNCDSIERDMKQ